MNFTDKQFEKIYLKLIMEADEGVQFKYICKSCNTGFTDENGVAEGDACPVESCEGGKVEKFIADDIDPDNMPTAYEANTEENDDADCDLLVEDGDGEGEDDGEFEGLFNEDGDGDLEEDEDLIEEDEEFEGLFNEDGDADFKEDDDLEEDEDLIEEDGEFDGLFNEDDDLQDEDADDEAAQEDTDADEEQTDADAEEVAEGAMLVSFTAEDAKLIQVLKQVQEGELKLVGVPLDFEFDEDELKDAPVISAETVDNFDITDVEAEETEEAETQEQEDADTQEDAQGDEDSTEDELAKECNRYMSGASMAKPSKYGPY